MKIITIKTAKVVFEEVPIIIPEKWFKKIKNITNKMDTSHFDMDDDDQYNEVLCKFEEEVLLPQGYTINEEPGRLGEPVSVQGIYFTVNGENKCFLDM